MVQEPAEVLARSRNALPVGPSRFEERRLYAAETFIFHTKKAQRMQTFLSRPQGGHSM
jgi:hypothetical protein